MPTQITPTERLLTATEFQRLSDVPPEIEWFANLGNRSTRRAYENAITISCGSPASSGRRNSAPLPARMSSPGVTTWPGASSAAARSATGWRRCRRCSSISARRTPSPTIRSKGVKRPKAENGEGKTPALGDHQARELLAAPDEETVKSRRDRALLFHALRREKLCKLRVKDFKQSRRGVPHLKVAGKGDKTRHLATAPGH